jgi:glycosyltransferase involved in cell wall biosynthesis
LKEDLGILFNRIKKDKGNFISIILPLYNEAESLPFVIKELFEYLPGALPGYKFEITFIDDCSTDSSYPTVVEFSKKVPANIKLSVAQLSKNSGSHVAITAGLNISRGDFTIIMASDGQDPAGVISQLIQEWENGNELVLASRSDNLDHGFLSKMMSRTAWKIMNWSTKINMPRKGCDLLGMDRIVLEAFNQMDERNTTFIFRILSLGFIRKEIEYVKRARVAGKTKWTIFRKFSIMLDAMTGFSNRPLKLITNLGLSVFIILVFRWLYVVFNIYILHNPPTELTILLNTIFTTLALQVLILGVIGDYIWRILDETRKRPVYEIRKIGGQIFEDDTRAKDDR